MGTDLKILFDYILYRCPKATVESDATDSTGQFGDGVGNRPVLQSPLNLCILFRIASGGGADDILIDEYVLARRSVEDVYVRFVEGNL